MKQVIDKYSNGNIWCKYYVNNRGNFHGLYIHYQNNSKLLFKQNWINGRPYGFSTYYSSNKIYKINYHL